MSIVRKAAAVEVDGHEFVLSDNTVDSYGDIIEAAGWDLRRFKQNPIALFGHSNGFPIGTWRDVRVEGSKLKGRLELAAEGTSPRIDELRRLVDQGILRAVSVGFRPLEYEPLDEKSPHRGVRYKRQELMETSLVSVPANPASLAVAKSLGVSDDTLDLAFGEHAETDGIRRRGISGEHAANPIPPRKTEMKTLSQRIEDAQNEIVQMRDSLAELNGADVLDCDAIEELNDRIDQKQRGLDAMKASEAKLAVRSAPAAPAATVPATAQRRPLSVPGRERKPGDLFIRSAAVFAVANVTGKDPEQIMERMYGSDEATGMIVKAAISGATTTGAGWAAELVNTEMTDFLGALRPFSVYPALADAGGGRLAFGPNQGAIKIPSRATTPSIGGSFVGEGAPIPVRRLGLTSITLSPKKMGVISVFSREIARYSTPAIETLIRNEIMVDTATTLDSLLLDATAGSAVRPAGLLNGVSALTATAGGGQAAFLADLKQLRAPFDSANAGEGLVLLMNPAQKNGLGLTPGADGKLGWANDILANYGLITSTAIPVGTVIMVRAADFVTAAGDVPEFELSDQAVIHMEDTAPAQIGTAGTPNVVAAPVQSMFQTAQIAIRMLLDVSWAMRRTGMVQYVTGVTW